MVKNSPINAGDLRGADLIRSRSGRSPGGGCVNSLQYFAWRIPWTEEAGGLQSIGCKELDVTERLTLFHFTFEGLRMLCDLSPV